MKAITISLVAHLTLLTALTLASIFAPGLLPIPRSVILAFHDNARMVRLEDIELPRPKGPATTTRGPRSSSPPIATNVPNPAPVDAPNGIAAETGKEGTAAADGNRNPGPIATGPGSVADIGQSEAPPPPVARQPVRLHAGIDAPRKIVDVTPGYPPLARSSRIAGIVILEATIDEHGDVTATKILRSIALLDQAATDAVRSWKYTPARLNGQPVAVLITVTVNFLLN
jgi:protein TonB